MFNTLNMVLLALKRKKKWLGVMFLLEAQEKGICDFSPVKES